MRLAAPSVSLATQVLTFALVEHTLAVRGQALTPSIIHAMGSHVKWFVHDIRTCVQTADNFDSVIRVLQSYELILGFQARPPWHVWFPNYGVSIRLIR